MAEVRLAPRPPVGFLCSPRQQGIHRFGGLKRTQSPSGSVQPKGFGQQDIDIRVKLAVSKRTGDRFFFFLRHSGHLSVCEIGCIRCCTLSFPQSAVYTKCVRLGGYWQFQNVDQTSSFWRCVTWGEGAMCCKVREFAHPCTHAVGRDQSEMTFVWKFCKAVAYTGMQVLPMSLAQTGSTCNWSSSS